MIVKLKHLKLAFNVFVFYQTQDAGAFVQGERNAVVFRVIF